MSQLQVCNIQIWIRYELECKTSAAPLPSSPFRETKLSHAKSKPTLRSLNQPLSIEESIAKAADILSKSPKKELNCEFARNSQPNLIRDLEKAPVISSEIKIKPPLILTSAFSSPPSSGKILL